MSDSDLSSEQPEADEDEIIPDGPEADLAEQARVVEERQSFEPTERRHDVPEADWYEQSIAEEVDDDR